MSVSQPIYPFTFLPPPSKDNMVILLPLEDPTITGSYILENLSAYLSIKKSKKDVLVRYLQTREALRKTKTQIARLFGVSQPYVSAVAKVVNRQAAEYPPYVNNQTYQMTTFIPNPAVEISLTPPVEQPAKPEVPQPKQTVTKKEYIRNEYSNYLSLMKNIPRSRKLLFIECAKFDYLDNENEINTIEYIFGLHDSKIVFFSDLSDFLSEGYVENFSLEPFVEKGIVFKYNKKADPVVTNLIKSTFATLHVLNCTEYSPLPSSLLIEAVNKKIESSIKQIATHSNILADRILASFTNGISCIGYIQSVFNSFKQINDIYSMAMIVDA